MKVLHDQKGTVNILLIMTIMMIGLLVMGSMLAITLTNLQTTQTVIRSKQAQYLAESCAEYALHGIYATKTYSGEQTLTFEKGDCTYTLLQLNPQYLQITATGSVGVTQTSLVARIQIDPEVEISTWEVN